MKPLQKVKNFTVMPSIALYKINAVRKICLKNLETTHVCSHKVPRKKRVFVIIRQYNTCDMNNKHLYYYDVPIITRTCEIETTYESDPELYYYQCNSTGYGEYTWLTSQNGCNFNTVDRYGFTQFGCDSFNNYYEIFV